MKASANLLRDPFGRPAGLALCPGLNWVSTGGEPLPTFFPVETGAITHTEGRTLCLWLGDRSAGAPV